MSKNGESTKPKNDEISNQSIRCRICGEVFDNNRSLANHFRISHMGGTLAAVTPSSNQANCQLLNPPQNVLALNRAATLQVAGPRRYLPPNVTTIITPRPTLPTLGQLVERVEETVSPDYCLPLINQLDRPIPEVIYVDDNDAEDPDLTLKL